MTEQRDVTALPSSGLSGSTLKSCNCAGPLSNVTVDGNGGHSFSCPENPRNLPEWRRDCAGCGIPFATPIPAGYPEGEYVCEACHD